MRWLNGSDNIESPSCSPFKTDLSYRFTWIIRQRAAFVKSYLEILIALPVCRLYNGNVLQGRLKSVSGYKRRSVKKTCQWQVFSVGHACFTGVVRWFLLICGGCPSDMRFGRMKSTAYHIALSDFPFWERLPPSVSYADSSPHKMGGVFSRAALRIIAIRKVSVPSHPAVVSHDFVL